MHLKYVLKFEQFSFFSYYIYCTRISGMESYFSKSSSLVFALQILGHRSGLCQDRLCAVRF